MKTTLDLPDEVMRAVKIRAAREDRKLKDVVTELLQRGLADRPENSADARQRVQLPLVDCAHAASPEDEMTPERVARVLLEEDALQANSGPERGRAGS